MAVFKEKNGARKASTYLCGKARAPIQPGRLTFDQNISRRPQLVGSSARPTTTTFNGPILKGGDSERKS
ncbi:MAG: hypothetical protein CEE38_19830 [Planctomycetes bacterium B3_Pla]|nr:MAG: hypothetical protein CEE38_19830 [Planctomycetes bacterium B3_Pla]